MKQLLKSVYSSIPGKGYLFITLKRFWQPPHNIYKHLHFQGIFRVRVPGNFSFKLMHYGFSVENDIFWTGITGRWEGVSLDLWIKLCANSRSIVDIGANTGVYALLAKSINPKAKVYAFEPVHRVFNRLKENVALNNYDIQVFEKAVSNNNGTATIYDTDTAHIYSVTVNKNLYHKDVEVIETQIYTVTMDSFIESHHVSGIDLMKIDVETHEPEVLEGFSKYLKAFKPTILVEVLNHEVGEKIADLISGLDYWVYDIHEKEGVRRIQKARKSCHFNILLCSENTARSIGLPTEITG